MTEGLLTPQQAAERLGTPLRFVRRLVEERRIGYTKIGRYVRFSPADLEAFIAAGRVEVGAIPTAPRHPVRASPGTRPARRRR
jgi:excisionase family DNA binding protein